MNHSKEKCIQLPYTII